MFKKKSFTLEKPKKSEGWPKLQEWIEKWNKIMACIFGILVFTLFFAIVVVNTTKRAYDVDDPESGINNIEQQIFNTNNKINERFQMCVPIAQDQCGRTCMSVTMDYLDSYFENLLQGNQCNNTFRVVIGIYFPDNILQNIWKLPLNLSITNLHVYSKNIVDIEINSFYHSAFHNVEILTLQHFNINRLKYGIFNGLENLSQLYIIESSIKNIDSNLLSPIRLSLTFIRISEIDYFTNITNLFGTTDLPKLETVELNHNNFSNSLNANNFIGLIGIRNLHLHHNGIEIIGENTFDPINCTIEIIQLVGNKLKTLPQNMLINLMSGSLKELYLASNSWTCDCNLSELLWHMNKYPNRFPDSTLIHCFPSNISITETTFCLSSTTTTISPTSLSTVQINTTNWPRSTTKDDLFSTKYLQPTIAPHFYECLNYKSRNGTAIFNIKPREQNITISKTAPQDISIALEKTSHNLTLLWSDIDLTKHMKCIFNLQYTIPLKEIQANKPYLFCFMQSHFNTTSPFDCHPYYIKLDNMWISQASRNLVIGLIAFLLAISMLLGCIFGYCLMRKNPGLMRGNKRVVIVNNNNKILSNKKKITTIENMAIPPELIGSTKGHGIVRYRRSSCGSIYGDKTYMTANPTKLQIIKWNRINSNVKSGQDDIYILGCSDISPPLPPPIPPPPPQCRNNYVPRPPPYYYNDNCYFDPNRFDDYYYMLKRGDMHHRNYRGIDRSHYM